jgi:hypothetical protein
LQNIIGTSARCTTEANNTFEESIVPLRGLRHLGNVIVATTRLCVVSDEISRPRSDEERI